MFARMNKRAYVLVDSMCLHTWSETALAAEFPSLPKPARDIVRRCLLPGRCE